jgi:hypothetical protein
LNPAFIAIPAIGVSPFLGALLVDLKLSPIVVLERFVSSIPRGSWLSQEIVIIDNTAIKMKAFNDPNNLKFFVFMVVVF